jgi:NADPH:quinone reductase-like Zn-dependent oxidoreductase
MKKIVIDKPGGYDQLQLKEFDDPHPGDRDILIEVHASGVNFADCCVRMGVYSSAKEFVGWPITPGFEVAGVITAVGSEVEKFTVGQRVVALTFFGGYTTP